MVGPLPCFRDPQTTLHPIGILQAVPCPPFLGSASAHHCVPRGRGTRVLHSVEGVALGLAPYVAVASVAGPLSMSHPGQV